MIPKTIHYCWFGRGEMPQLAKDCIASWHRHMPDWHYKLWNEDNFDVDSIPYTNRCAKVKQLSIADLFAETIRRVESNESISSQYLI